MIINGPAGKSEMDKREGWRAAVRSDPARGTRALPSRRHPAHGVFFSRGIPTIVFLTVCAKDRQTWLADTLINKSLVEIWKAADAWKIGYYLIMPDHLHLFCAPSRMEFTLKTWVVYWKREFSCLKLKDTGLWQRDFWDTRLRHGENYHDKWEYVRQNPVRKGLVQNADDWPFQGILNELRW